MKSKIPKIFSVLFALVLLVSLGLVMAAPVSAAATGDLVVHITLPTGTPELICVGDTFTVTATVENTDSVVAAHDVEVIIDIPAGAELVTGTVTQLIAEDPLAALGTSSPVSWDLLCTAPGDITITVTPQNAFEDEPPTVAWTGGYTAGTVGVQQQRAELEVIISAPPPPATITECQTFNLVFDVVNNGNVVAKGVTVSIDPGDEAEVDTHGEGVPVLLFIGNIDPGSPVEDVTVLMHCTGAGPTTITVTPAGTDGCSDVAIAETYLTADTVSITQEGAAELTIAVTVPEDTYLVCTNFLATVRVENIGEEGADAVVATVTVDDVDVEIESGGATAPLDFGVIAGGTFEELTVLLHCKGAGLDSVIQAQITAGTAANTGDDLTDPVVSGQVTVNQYDPAVLTVAVDTDKDEYNVCEDITVTVTLGNTAGVPGEDINNATPELTFIGDASWVSGPTPSSATIAAGETEDFIYVYHCEGVVDVTFTANATGTAAMSSDPLTAGPEPVTVTQVVPTLTVVITEPDDGEVKVVGQMFQVFATVTNNSDTPQTVVTATITPKPGSAVLVSGDNSQALGDLAAGESAVASWWVRCEAVDSSTTLQVDAASFEMATATDTNTVDQRNPTHPGLTASVDGPEKAYVSQTFSIHAEITNTGQETAMDVSATLVIGAYGDTGTAELVAEESTTKILGDIAPGQTYMAEWTVHCTGAGVTTFTVTPAGYDDITDLAIPGSAITPGSDTVNQVVREGIQVVIDSPAPLTKWGPACGPYDIEFTVTNTGYSGLTDVTVTLVIDGNAVWVSGGTAAAGHPISVGTILQGAAGYGAIYTIDCTGEDDPPDYTTFTVTVTGYDEICEAEVTDFDVVEVYQKYIIVDAYLQTPQDEFCVGNDIVVGFDVTNCYSEQIGNVQAEITILGLAHLFAGDALIDLDDIPSGSTVITAEAWHVECDGAGPVTITVHVFGIYGVLTLDNTDTITFNQVTGPVLEATIETDACDWVTVGSTYNVTGTVENTGDGTATSGSMTLDVTGLAAITGSATVSVPTLAPGGSYSYAWQLTCTGPTLPGTEEDCAVDMHVDASATGACGAVTDASPTLTVSQFPLAVTVTAIPSTVLTGETFSVDAVIKNVGGGDDCPCEIDDVVATISFLDDNASLAGGETAAKSVGTVPWNIEQSGVEGMKAQWTVRCDRPSPATIMVTVTTTYLTCPISVYDTVIVTQNPAKITYEVPLAKDWNFFSVPIFPIDTDIEEVLYSISITAGYTEVWSYVGQEWQVYKFGADAAYYAAMAAAGIEKITDIEAGIGYIIRMIDPGILTGQGYELEPGAEPPPTYELLPGWNLTGFKTMDFSGYGQITQALDTMRVGYYLGNVDANYDTFIIGQEARFLRWYNPGEGWKELAQNDNMWIGKGCWLWASQSGLVIVPPVVAE